MPKPIPPSLTVADLEALADIERAIVALHQAFAQLSPSGWHAISEGFVPLSNEAFSCYFERLDSLQ